MIDDVIAFLRARLDAEQRAIQAYREHRAHPETCDNVDDYDSCSLHIATAKATVYRDPDFGLADVAAKRAILGRAERIIASFDDPANAPWPDVSRRERSHAIETIHDLALPYANDPGFKSEWRTD